MVTCTVAGIANLQLVVFLRVYESPQIYGHWSEEAKTQWSHLLCRILSYNVLLAHFSYGWACAVIIFVTGAFLSFRDLPTTGIGIGKANGNGQRDADRHLPSWAGLVSSSSVLLPISLHLSPSALSSTPSWCPPYYSSLDD
jgi:hypothetical protein